MKVDILKVKDDLFKEACRCLPTRIVNYSSSNFKELGIICKELVTIEEYVIGEEKNVEKYYEPLINYFENIYRKIIFLVLKNDKDCFSYTPKDLIKFIRGEGLHGASVLKNDKRKTLHYFAFENNSIKKPTIEFAITKNFIIYPGLRFASGNVDSSNPFLEIIRIEAGNGIREIKLTTLESIIIAIGYDIYNLLNFGEISWKGRMAVTNSLDVFRNSLGDEIVTKLIDQENFCLDLIKNK